MQRQRPDKKRKASLKLALLPIMKLFTSANNDQKADLIAVQVVTH